VIDWRSIMTKERVVEIFEEAGYELWQEETFFERDYICIFKLRGNRTEDADTFD
jgi:hypothetical protein